jgi:hypothetical protein
VSALAVTDMSCAVEFTAPSRNGHVIALVVVERHRCGGCERDLAVDEPVWRVWWNRRGLRSICQACRRCYGWGRRYVWSSGPCEGCGRIVNEARWRPRRFCSRICEDGYYAEQRRARRAEARAGRRCDVCAELLDAGRADARYCSSACRQKAYRRRRAAT